MHELNKTTKQEIKISDKYYLHWSYKNKNILRMVKLSFCTYFKKRDQFWTVEYVIAEYWICNIQLLLYRKMIYNIEFIPIVFVFFLFFHRKSIIIPTTLKVQLF